MFQLRWRFAPELTAAYAAWQWTLGETPPDERLLGATREILSAFDERLAVAELSAETFWQAMLGSLTQGSAEATSLPPALSAAGCSPLVTDSIAAALAGLLTDLRLSILQVLPKLADQLPLRARPLQEQWDAHGPGLMRQIGKLTHADLLPKRVNGLWIHPWLGGGGTSIPQSQAILVEAVLTNPLAELPEVVRIAWLAAQVGMARAEANVLVPADRLPRVVAAALIPVVLSAAAKLELVAGRPEQIALALTKWRPPFAAASDLKTLNEWWDQFSAGSTPFPVALKALDRMLQ
jgi:hypothetical protein